MRVKNHTAVLSLALCSLALPTLANSSDYLSFQERLGGAQKSASEAKRILNELRSPLLAKKLTGNAVDFQDKAAACNNDEETYLQIEKNVLFPFFNALKEKNFSAAQKLMTDSAKVKGSFWGSNGSFDGYNVSEWAADPASPLSQLFAEFSEIEDISFETLSLRSDMIARDKNLAFPEAMAKVELDLRGKTKNLRRVQLSGFLTVSLAKEKSQWKVAGLEVGEGQSVQARSGSPAFAKVSTEKAFGSKLHNYVRSEAIRRGGYALAVNDFDGDNRPDIYVGSVNESQMFKNTGGMGFAPAPAQPVDTMVKSAAFADFDNDGDQDLLVIRFAPEAFKDRLNGQSSVLVYENKGEGKFVKLDQPISSLKWAFDRAMAGAIADFDNDGRLDFYVGYPGARDFTHLDMAKNKLLDSHGLYFGDKSNKFTPLDPEKFKASFLTYNRGFPHSALAVDYNHDSNVDLLIIDDSGGLSTAFTNLGNRNFSQQAEQIGLGNHGYGMAVSAADFNNDGYLDLVMTNVEMAAQERFDTSCYQNWGDEPLLKRHNKREALRVFLGTKNMGFTEVATNRLGLQHHGYGLSGVRFMDFDNDGLQDLYVTNGLWSGTDRAQKFDSYFVRSRVSEKVKGLQARLERSLMNRTQSMYMDVLSFFRGDLEGKDKTSARPSLAGFQRNRLYKNLKDRFIDVAYLEGVDSIADGYMVASADLDGDQRTDLVLRNADRGSKDVEFDSLEIFANQSENTNAVDIRLQGTRSNTDGIGARVTVQVGKDTQTQTLVGLEGTVQSSKVMHFGLGKATKADLVKIYWPSGATTEIKNMKKGFHVVNEGSTVRYSKR